MLLFSEPWAALSEMFRFFVAFVKSSVLMLCPLFSFPSPEISLRSSHECGSFAPFFAFPFLRYPLFVFRLGWIGVPFFAQTHSILRIVGFRSSHSRCAFFARLPGGVGFPVFPAYISSSFFSVSLRRVCVIFRKLFYIQYLPSAFLFLS